MGKRILCAVTLILLLLVLMIMAISLVGLFVIALIAYEIEEGIKKLFNGITE